MGIAGIDSGSTKKENACCTQMGNKGTRERHSVRGPLGHLWRVAFSELRGSAKEGVRPPLDQCAHTLPLVGLAYCVMK